jgi:serine/threonine-protein kinase
VKPVEPLPPRYRDPRPLGRGSFAVVFTAEDAQLGRRVAVKVLREELAADEKARRRFAREVRTAALLGTHPHIVTIHDAGDWNGRPYLVMELLVGSVAERLQSAKVPHVVALRWLAQAAEALEFAHAHGVVHRDVKPGNLLLDERGDVRLSDFGVVRGATRGGDLTLPGEVVGTPGYLAPEVARGGPATAASDVYSLALVARDLVGDHPALQRGLAEDPRERCPSSVELVSALAGDEERTQVALLPVTRVLPVSETNAMRARPTAPTAHLRRHRLVRVGRAAAVIATIAAASAAAGAYVTARIAPAATGRAALPRSLARVETCAISPFEDDANVVVAGAAAGRFCRAQAHVLRLDGDRWTYRAGRELFAPHHGADALAVVCRLRRGPLRATVYDTGSRSIGEDLCGWYASGGWERAIVA